MFKTNLLSSASRVVPSAPTSAGSAGIHGRERQTVGQIYCLLQTCGSAYAMTPNPPPTFLRPAGTNFKCRVVTTELQQLEGCVQVPPTGLQLHHCLHFITALRHPPHQHAALTCLSPAGTSFTLGAASAG